MGGKGRTGPIDLAVRDHGCSGKWDVVKNQPAGAKGVPVLAVGGKDRGITQGFPQELWMTASDPLRLVVFYVVLSKEGLDKSPGPVQTFLNF
ncbi:hypothetical protein GCM10009108_26520 [Castellaniella ginsengisoli]|uniref:Uncharacterized protein n=1 Tax=Castellaniella ginsengisoli TaxID=546114 RepID=A0ABN1L1T4_9BURK